MSVTQSLVRSCSFRHLYRERRSNLAGFTVLHTRLWVSVVLSHEAFPPRICIIYIYIHIYVSISRLRIVDVFGIGLDPKVDIPGLSQSKTCFSRVAVVSLISSTPDSQIYLSPSASFSSFHPPFLALH